MKNKRRPPADVDEYIAGFPNDVQKILQAIRATIHRAAPGAKEVISYRIPAFRLNGVLVYFAAFKSHIGLYPTSTAIRKFKKELSAYEHAKGTIRFPFGKQVPLSLISRIVKFRVKENLTRAKVDQSK
jgi:uncharacterized protein YdhG (YjbR/CyaY superfamily)